MSLARRLLLDTNVFVAALVSGSGAPARLLRLAELPEVLGRRKFRRYLTTSEARQAVELFRSLAVIVDDPPAPVVPITDDPDDDYLVVLAESAGVCALVSGDPHLTGLDRPGLVVLTPREALSWMESEPSIQCRL